MKRSLKWEQCGEPQWKDTITLLHDMAPLSSTPINTLCLSKISLTWASVVSVFLFIWKDSNTERLLHYKSIFYDTWDWNWYFRAGEKPPLLYTTRLPGHFMWTKPNQIKWPSSGNDTTKDAPVVCITLPPSDTSNQHPTPHRLEMISTT